MLQLPNPSSLAPQMHPVQGAQPVACFPSSATPLVKLDLRFEAGSAYQPHKLVSAAAANLFTLATARRTSQQVAELIDACGIVVEPDTDLLFPGISLYAHRRHLPKILPLVEEWLCEPRFNADDFEAYRHKRRLQLCTDQLKTNLVARHLFYQSIFGPDHIMGRHATPADADSLALAEVEAFFRARYTSPRVALAGAVEEAELSLLDRHLPRLPQQPPATRLSAVPPPDGLPAQHLRQPVEGAAQTTVRIGRILPLAWDSPDYAAFMLLCTALGGYFGSRLMTNIREEKGYTYGIYASTQVYRGCIVLYIVADVAPGAEEATVSETFAELERLRREPLSPAELERVRTVLAADFLRSVDGVFERSARYLDMQGTGVTEQLTANMAHALQHTTPEELQQLAQRLLRPADMTVCLAGLP